MGRRVTVPCRDPEPKHRFDKQIIGDIHTFWAMNKTDDYFVAPEKIDRWFGTDTGEIYALVGEHYCRSDANSVCLRNVLTGEQVDVEHDTFTDLLLGDVWTSLTEMEVLAWAAR